MSWSEVAVLLGRKRIEAVEEFDEIDTWPVVRRIVPAESCGIRTPGMRRAQPFDGLVA